MKRLLITIAIVTLVAACGTAGPTGSSLELSDGPKTEATVRDEARGFLGELNDADALLACVLLPDADAPIAVFVEMVSTNVPTAERQDHARALQIIAEECEAR